MKLKAVLPFFAVAIVVCGVCSASTLNSEPKDTEPHPTRYAPASFSVDKRLKKNLDFWVRIYSHYYTHDALVHDAKYIDRVYEVVDLRSAPKGAMRDAKKKWKKILLSVHRKQNSPGSMTEEEKKVFDLYADINDPNKFLAASHRRRLRVQQGQKDQFLAGLIISGRYLPLMEEIFRKEGLPIELTRLPFVESSFNIRARSKVGASGIWQFMRSTGKLFLKVNNAVDERNDPIRAAEAAAKLLKGNYESLKSWPLAVTAYNHGRKGMMRAVLRVGSSDLEDIADEYRSRSFGFASGNFFTELLAAVEVEKNAEKYFGPIEREKPLRFYEVEVPDYVHLKDMVKFLRLNVDAIRELNPALAPAVFAGQSRVPAGYKFRLPLPSSGEADSEARVFRAGYAQIPGVFKHRGQRQ